MMRLFSSRRESITADLRARATRFEQQCRTFDGCIQLLDYVPTILAGLPGTNTVSA
jgi:hypothetical protein